MEWNEMKNGNQERRVENAGENANSVNPEFVEKLQLKETKNFAFSLKVKSVFSNPQKSYYKYLLENETGTYLYFSKYFYEVGTIINFYNFCVIRNRDNFTIFKISKEQVKFIKMMKISKNFQRSNWQYGY